MELDAVSHDSFLVLFKVTRLTFSMSAALKALL